MGRLFTHPECILDPRELRCCWMPTGGDHVKPAGKGLIAGMIGQEQPGGLDQFMPLARIHRGRATAKPGMAAVADFDKYQHFARAVVIEHYQIDLPKARADIGRDWL